MTGAEDKPAPAEAKAAVYDPLVAEEIALGLLSDLQLQLHSGRVADALGAPLLDRIRRTLHDVATRARRDFRIAVIGDFKRGKSTLINALIGQEVAPMDVVPETMTLNIFQWRDAARASLRFEDGTEAEIAVEDLTRPRLEPILARHAQRPALIEVGLPNPALEGRALIDTPGSDDVRPDLDALIRRSIADCDLLILVVSAAAPLSLRERELLRSTVLPHEFSRMFCVVNRIDLLANDQDIARVTERVAREVTGIFPGAHVFALSAKAALDPEWLQAGRADDLLQRFADFQATLDDILASQRDTMRTERLVFEALRALADTRHLVGQLIAMLAESKEGLAARTAALHDEGRALDERFEQRADALRVRVSALSDAATVWMRGFAERVLTEAGKSAASLAPDALLRDSQFYVAECARKGLAACLDEHSAAIEAVARELSDDGITAMPDLDAFVQGAGDALYGGPQPAGAALVRSAIQAGLGLGPIVDVGMYLLDRNKSGRTAAQIGRELAAAAPRVREAFGTLTRQTYACVGEQLIEHLTAARAAASEAAREAAARATLLHEREESSLEETSRVLKAADEMIASSIARLRELRAGLA